MVYLALEKPEKTASEPVLEMTDNEGYFISESSVYRILKSFDVVTRPVYFVLAAGKEFRHKTKRINELLQTDSPYFNIVGWLTGISFNTN